MKEVPAILAVVLLSVVTLFLLFAEARAQFACPGDQPKTGALSS